MWQILGTICAVGPKDSLRGSRMFVFLRHWNTTCQSVSRCKLTEHNLENFTIRGRFVQKMQKLLLKFQVLRL